MAEFDISEPLANQNKPDGTGNRDQGNLSPFGDLAATAMAIGSPMNALTAFMGSLKPLKFKVTTILDQL